MIWKGCINKVLRGLYPKIPKYFSGDLSLIIKAMLKVSPNKRPSCKQILNTSIISSRLDTLFPNEIKDNEDVLLQTIYIPKKLTYLTERLPKSTYEDDGGTDDESLNTRYFNMKEDTKDSLPTIEKSSLKKGNTIKVKRRKDSMSKSSSYSDYSYNHAYEKGKADNSYSIDTNLHEKGLLSPPEEYDNIYSSKADYSSGKVNKLSSRREKGMINNSSDSKIKIQRIKNLVKPDMNPNLKIEKEDKIPNRVPNESEELSRNNSLVVVTSMDKKKNMSKSRPKQRHSKLIDNNERFNSVMQILAASEEIDKTSQRNSKRKNVVSDLKKYSIPGRSKISISLASEKHRVGGRKNNNLSVHKYSGKRIKKQKPRIGMAYISKPRMEKYPSIDRSNSHINRGKKSVSIVSLSPNESLNYGKDIDLYNPYNKPAMKQKIHLPYLKNRRAMPRIRHDVRQVKPRNDQTMKNTSVEVLTSSNKNYNSKSLKNNKSFDLLREVKNLKKRIPKPKVEDFDPSYKMSKR